MLLITADQDKLVKPEDTRRVAATLPHATLAVLPGCGHVPQEECPRRFMAAVTRMAEAGLASQATDAADVKPSWSRGDLPGRARVESGAPERERTAVESAGRGQEGHQGLGQDGEDGQPDDGTDRTGDRKDSDRDRVEALRTSSADRTSARWV